MHNIDALIVSHGQPSSPDPAEDALADYVAQVQTHLPDIRLGSATLAKSGALDAQLAHMPESAPVYPLFMSDGWFVRTCLAGRIGTAPVRVMTPFGMDAALPALAADHLRKAGWIAGEPILLAAHGSGSGRPAPERATFDFANALASALDTKVEVAFLEQDPMIPNTVRDMGTTETTLCLPFFAMAGDHVRRDVHAALRAGGFKGQVLPVISQLQGVAHMVAHAIRADLGEARPTPKVASA